MPIERRSSSAQVRTILIAIVSLVFIVTLGYAVVRAATGQRTTVTATKGDGRWNTGSAASKAKEIAAGGPILIPDPAGSQRLPIFISHVGTDNKAGWYAFEARPPDAADDCFLEWDRKASEFRTAAACDDEATYPVDGAGLRQFGTSVTKDGDLVVDLTPSSTSSTSSTTTP